MARIRALSAIGGGSNVYIGKNVNINPSTPSTLTITVGFEPKKILFVAKHCVSYTREFIYDVDEVTASKDYEQIYYQSPTGQLNTADGKFSDNSVGFAQITSTGFVMKSFEYSSCYFIAVG